MTGISGAKIYITSRDRIFDVPIVDWTYNIDYCFQHLENNMAIIIACVPAVRHLIYKRTDDRGGVAQTFTTARPPQGWSLHRISTDEMRPEDLANLETAHTSQNERGIKMTEFDLHQSKETKDTKYPPRETWNSSPTSFDGPESEGDERVLLKPLPPIVPSKNDSLDRR